MAKAAKQGTYYIEIAKIKPNPKNPRVIKDEKYRRLCTSLRNFPEMLDKRPLVCFTDIDGKLVVLGGNMRLKAATELGMKTLPVTLADDWTEEQRAEFLIKDNVGFGEWNWEELQADWDVKQLEDWGLDIPQQFMVEPEAVEDDYEIPDEIKTDIVLGDLFEVGEHRLLCGDSTQTDTFEKLFNGQMADLVVTDPPYNVALGMETVEQAKKRNRRTDGLTIKNDKMSNDDFYQFLYDFYSALGAYTKLGGSWYVWFADMEVINFSKAFVDSGFKLAQMLIWKKSSLIMGRKDYQFNHEPCLYGWKEGAAHSWYSDRKQTSVFEFDKPSRNGEHPTMKPVTLFSYQIGNSSKQGDIVADGFAGSGTTMVACHQMQRKAYLVEYDPKYCQVIIDRMRKLDPNISIKKNGVAL